MFLRVVSGEVFFAARPMRLVYSFRFANGWEFFCSGSAMTDRVYQLEKLGWCLDPTFSGGLHPLLGVFFSGVLGLTLPAASVTFFAGEEMAYGHLPRPAHSSTSRHAGFPNVLLSVPFQNFEDASSGWWTASVCLLRPPVTSTTGSFLQGFVCNSFFFHGCPCKLYDVNYQIFL